MPPRRKRAKPKTTGCPVGRQLNLKHPTCQTCPIDCSGGERSGGGIGISNTWHEGKLLFTSAYLYSPNKWHGRPLAVYLEEKRKWRKVRDGAWALWGRQGKARRQVIVTRQVTSVEHLINDDDNLRFCLKPVLDNLKYHGVIVDDAREYIAETIITQVVGDRQLVTVEVKEAGR